MFLSIFFFLNRPFTDPQTLVFIWHNIANFFNLPTNDRSFYKTLMVQYFRTSHLSNR